MLKKNIYNHLKFTGKSPNIHEFLINLFFFLLVCIIFYWKNLQYDFTFFTDQDHVHIFEALTFNSLKEQKYFDHPGTICFITLGIWLKILDLLNVISFSDLKYSNYDLDELNDLIFYSRIFNLFISFLILISFKRLLNLLKKNKLIIYFFLIIFILSSAYYGLLVRIRTEIFSILFYLIFLNTLISAINTNSIFKYLLSGAFMVLALSAKVQIIILIIFTPIILNTINKKISTTYLYLDKKIVFILFSIVVIGLNLHLSVFYNLNYIYDHTFYIFSYLYYFLIILTIANFNIFQKVDRNLIKSNCNKYLLILSGIYTTLIISLFLPFITFDTIFVILTPIEKLFSFSGGNNSINRILSDEIFRDLIFLVLSLDIQEILFLFIIFSSTFFYANKKFSYKKHLILIFVWILIKFISTFRYGQNIPSYYLMYSYLILFLSITVIMDEINLRKKILYFFFIIILLTSLLNFFKSIYPKIDKERSELNFCSYVDDLEYAHYYSHYYCK